MARVWTGRGCRRLGPCRKRRSKRRTTISALLLSSHGDQGAGALAVAFAAPLGADLAVIAPEDPLQGVFGGADELGGVGAGGVEVGRVGLEFARILAGAVVALGAREDELELREKRAFEKG